MIRYNTIFKTKSKKAQSSVEFVILVGFVMIAFTIFFLVINESTSEKTESRMNNGILEIALIVKNEVDLASNSMEGYSRDFTLPYDVYGKDYEVYINDSIVFVESYNSNHKISLPLAQVSGKIIKFQNRIKKENGQVKLNS